MIARDAPFYYRFLQWLVRLLLKILTRLDVSGLEHVPLSGALVFAPNHLHILDTVVLFAIFPRRLIVLASDHWRGTAGGWLLSVVGKAIFISRGELDRQALSHSLSALRAGAALAVAPEGTRSRTGGLLPGKDGAVYLASRTASVIVPAAAWGQESVLRSWARLRRPVVNVRIGEPIRLPPKAARARLAELHAYTESIMLRLARMLPAEYRGVYAERV